MVNFKTHKKTAHNSTSHIVQAFCSNCIYKYCHFCKQCVGQQGGIINTTSYYVIWNNSFKKVRVIYIKVTAVHSVTNHKSESQEESITDESGLQLSNSTLKLWRWQKNYSPFKFGTKKGSTEIFFIKLAITQLCAAMAKHLISQLQHGLTQHHHLYKSHHYDCQPQMAICTLTYESQVCIKRSSGSGSSEDSSQKLQICDRVKAPRKSK